MRKFYLSSLLILISIISFGQIKNKLSGLEQIAQKPDPIEESKESVLAAEDAGQIPVQGRLTDGGSPVNGTREFVFTINLDSTSWSETHPTVQVTNGFYSIALGSITPIPESLFEGTDSREVQISVDGTPLSPITIYSPFGTDVGRFLVQDTQDSSSTALSAINKAAGTGGTQGIRTGIYAEASGPGNNTGLFAYAENGRSINNQTELTDPEVYLTGQLGSLYGNSNVGGRAIQGQYTATGPGHGIGLSGYSGGEGMNWGVWGRANAFTDSMQVGGYLEAFGAGAGDLYGVWGQATGANASRNIGVYGTAFGSPNENWAGLFDGNVLINGDLELNGNLINFGESDAYRLVFGISEWKTFDSGFGLSSQINFSGGVQGDSLLLPGGASIGNKGWEEINPRNGYVHVNDSSGINIVKIEAVTDSSNTYGYLEMQGQNGKRFEANNGGLKLFNNENALKSELNIFESNDAGSLVLYGNNDSTKVILGSTSGGYGGYLGLYDSLRFIGAQIRVSNKGRGNLYTYNENHQNVGWFGGIGNDGFVQLVSYDDSEAFSGAVLIGSFIDSALPEVYLEGSAQQNFGLARLRVTKLGGSSEETAFFEINRSNGGGQATMTIVQDEGGADPTGNAGELFLWGDSSPNIQAGANGFQDHDLGVLNIYGSIEDGGGWYYNGLQAGMENDGGDIEYGYINLFANNSTNTSSVETVRISGNYGGTEAGGLKIMDSLGTITAEFIGDGHFNMFYPNTGNQFVSANTSTGRFIVHTANGQQAARLFSGGFDGNFGRFRLYGNDNEVHLENGVDDSGAGYSEYYGPGPSFHTNVRIGQNGSDPSSGGIRLFNNGIETITINGETGVINVDTLYANLLFSTDGSVQTSDRRYKKNIKALTNALYKTSQLRGVSYNWKDSNRSQSNQIGVIAQEVEEVYPEFVHTDDKGMKAVNYAQLTAVLIEAIKELNTKVEALESENEVLKAELAKSGSSEIEALKVQIAEIKALINSSSNLGK